MKNKMILEKIITYIDSITKYIKDIDYEEFNNNKMMAEACAFNLSQIGELVNRLDKEYISENQQIPWIKMRGLRNRLIHDYEGVNLILVWEIISEDLIELKKQLKVLI